MRGNISKKIGRRRDGCPSALHRGAVEILLLNFVFVVQRVSQRDRQIRLKEAVIASDNAASQQQKTLEKSSKVAAKRKYSTSPT